MPLWTVRGPLAVAVDVEPTPEATVAV